MQARGSLALWSVHSSDRTLQIRDYISEYHSHSVGLLRTAAPLYRPPLESLQLTPYTRRRVGRLLQRTGATLSSPLVLVDVGASLQVHRDFSVLRPLAIVLAFDADERELPGSTGSGLRVVNKAVVPPEAIRDGKANFILCKNPTLSSTLEPNSDVADEYSVARRLDRVREIEVSATTLEQAIQEQGLRRIDWLKLDTQGTDGRLVASLPDHLAAGLVCVDVEPGTDAFYRGEDTFESVHALMKSLGFRLARLESIDAARISRQALQDLLPHPSSLIETAVDISLSRRYRSPVAVNARYMRDPRKCLEMSGTEGLRRLWLCAMAVDLFPFAFDVARCLQAAEPSGENALLLRGTRQLVRRSMISPLTLARKLTASRIRRARKLHF